MQQKRIHSEKNTQTLLAKSTQEAWVTSCPCMQSTLKTIKHTSPSNISKIFSWVEICWDWWSGWILNSNQDILTGPVEHALTLQFSQCQIREDSGHKTEVNIWWKPHGKNVHGNPRTSSNHIWIVVSDICRMQCLFPLFYPGWFSCSDGLAILN